VVRDVSRIVDSRKMVKAASKGVSMEMIVAALRGKVKGDGTDAALWPRQLEKGEAEQWLRSE
jgi:hypothetical protein